MALSKKLLFENGVETNYHVIGMVESNAQNNKTVVFIHSFISKEIYKKAIEKQEKLQEQKNLVEEFDKLIELENPTKTQQTKISRLQKNINDLANDIDKLKDYTNFVAVENIVDIPYQEDLSIDNLQKQIIEESKIFKSAMIVA